MQKCISELGLLCPPKWCQPDSPSADTTGEVEAGMTESDLPVTEMVRGRWGDPQHPVALPEAAAAALRHLGVKAPAPPATG